MNTSASVPKNTSSEIASAPGKPATPPVFFTCSARVSASNPSEVSDRIAPVTSCAASSFAPLSLRMRAAQDPTLPKPCTV